MSSVVLLFHRLWFQYRRDGRFLHLDFYVVGHFNDYRSILHVRDKAMNAGACDDAVARFYACDQFLLLFLPFFLWPDHHEIHDDENENEWHKGADPSDRTAWGGSALCLS